MEFRYGLDDRPPPLEWLFLGLQWFAVAVPSIIILGKIICTVGPAGACDPLVYLQKMFFIAALFMLIQIFLGHGLPLIVGPSTVILIGILIPTVSAVRKASYGAKTQQIISQLATGIEAFDGPETLFAVLPARLGLSVGRASTAF